MTFDDFLRRWVRTPSRVAVVGASPREDRPVASILGYLVEQGFTVYPINPGYAGTEIRGRTCLAGLADLPEPVDLVVFFLAPEKQAESLHRLRQLVSRQVAWFQPGAENPLAEDNLRREGYEVVEACILVTHRNVRED